ncbi:glycoside hydrolase family 88 protein [uncultured Bacteroides sp.]|uniref:glycoside hydrolase family 88 protein n=1 Tax=uncultured Bacteroides sp. TaxID=162156 RepID=UPI00280ACBBD|nr:glycoside hydrolase family 88 protein [uncultured Bacteroides sp.]
MRNSRFAFYSLILLLLAGCTGTDSKKQFIGENMNYACEQTRYMLESLGDTNGRYPRSTKKGGSLSTTDIYGWTSGFFPGTLWFLYEFTNDSCWKEKAVEWTLPLEPNRTNTKDHDVGFMMYNSFGKGFALTKNESYRDILVQTANSLMTRYNPNVHSIQSWEGGKSHHDTIIWQFPVIIDNMMNLELLFWAARETGDKKYHDVAVTHANTTIKNHLREDFSCYHVVDYDTITGEVRDRATAQGYADNSAWARGQAWGIYGFTMVYRETGDSKYLSVAQKMADFFLHNPSLPEDKVPLWDFNAGQDGYTKKWKFDETKIGYIPRDASAAAIAASALFELYQYTKNPEYYDSAVTMIHSLASEQYRAVPGSNAGFLLMHSTGSLPHGKEIDVPLVYADYYFLEALLRYQKIGKES